MKKAVLGRVYAKARMREKPRSGIIVGVCLNTPAHCESLNVGRMTSPALNKDNVRIRRNVTWRAYVP